MQEQLTPDYLRKRFQRRLEIHQRDTRQKNDLSLPSAGSRVGKGPLPFMELKFLILQFLAIKSAAEKLSIIIPIFI